MAKSNKFKFDISDFEPISESNNESFSAHDFEPVESFGESLKKAPGRIMSDVSSGAINLANNIPGYLEKAKTELPAFTNPVGTFSQHPLNAIKQALAGVNEGVNSIAQLPLNVSRYGSERLNLLPQGITNALQTITPEDTTESINQLFGEPKYPGEATLRGITRNALPLAGFGKIGKAIPPLTRKGATKTLKKARQLAEERNIGNLNVDPALIEDTRQFLPNTLPNRNLLNDALSGDYNTLFKLQSDVGKNAGDYAKSLFSAAERSHGRAGLDTRNSLLEAIHQNLQSQGHHDISNLLREGQNEYRRYMAFKPYRNILALTGLGMLLPKNAITNIASKILSHRTQQ